MFVRNTLKTLTLAAAVAMLAGPAFAQNGAPSVPPQVAAVSETTQERDAANREARLAEAPSTEVGKSSESYRDRPPHIPGYDYRK